MKFLKFGDESFLLSIIYVVSVLVGLYLLTYIWLPTGYTLAGHDSGLPLDAKQFLSTRLYAWDDRIGFGIDNSVNFGSLTIHFIDWLASAVAGTSYAGNNTSVFFWLGLIFVSGFIFSYQLKDSLGRVFVFILPLFLTFNFYIFQSMFMLERAKFGVFSALLIVLAVYFRLQQKRLRVIQAALITALVFSVFNGGGLFGVTLFGGVFFIFSILVALLLFQDVKSQKFEGFKKILQLLVLSAIFYLAFNAYALLPYIGQFSVNNPQAILQDSLFASNKEWLAYVSRSSSYLNLFRFLGIPDWYGGFGQLDKANIEHPYASVYLDNFFLTAVSFLFPILSFASLLLAKKGVQRRTLSLFAVISLVGLFFTAGSHKPLGFVYEFLMGYLPGFVLFRSAFYKFGVFYLLGMLVMFAFTLSFFVEGIVTRFMSVKWYKPGVAILTLLVLGLWGSYHWVLFDSTKIFAWKQNQSTKVQIPNYIYDFSNWAKDNDIGDKRVLLLPPVNKDWESDAYDWGYWSLSPLPYALSNMSVISEWHGLTSEERALVKRLYSSIEKSDETKFLTLAQRLNVGYFLLRNDVLTDSSWSSQELPEVYQKALESLQNIKKVKSFGEWELYMVTQTGNTAVYATTYVNFAQDKYLTLANEFFDSGHAVGSSALKIYPELGNLQTKGMEIYDCLSCPLERKSDLQSIPDINILPNSIFYVLKEKREQKLLAQNKDSRSKLADYLGIVLRRSAEQQSMYDLGVNEKYLISNASVIRSYLNNIYSELSSLPERARDFEVANQVLEYLNQTERVFNNQIEGSDFKSSSQEFTEETLGVVWNIELIKDFFEPLLGNIEQWSTKKVYKIMLAEKREYDLFFPVASLPQDIAGKPIYPQSVEYRNGGESKTLEVESANNDWLRARINGEIGKSELALLFPDLPNLLNIESSGSERFSFGRAGCFKGNITNFEQKRAYEVRVWKSDRLKPAKIIFRDDSFIYSDKHGFLQGEDSFEIPASSEGSYARYVYFPSVSADKISLYICSDNADLPAIDKIEVKEFFSLPVIGIRGAYTAADKTLNIDYKRIDPTKYEAEVSGVQESPYVLIFNAKFNPSWKLSIERQDGSIAPVTKHFMIDGYANGWLVTERAVKKLKIEYAPQAVFNKASVFSSASLLTGVAWLIFSFFRGSRKKENGKE